MQKKKIIMAIGFCILIIGAYIIPAAAEGDLHLKRFLRVKAMTYNVYVGADLLSILGLINDPPANNPLAIPMAVADLFQAMQDTNFPERAVAIADQIKRFRPHLIGLQEVSLIMLQSPANPEPADKETDLVFDYLELLLAELEGQYELVVVGERVDIEMPMWRGEKVEGMPLLEDVRLIQRDVILVRWDVTTSPGEDFIYDARIPLGDPAEPVAWIKRGFVATNATVNGQTYRFVNTHLEVQDLPDVGNVIQLAQAQQLIGLLATETLPIILVGDFNCEPDPTVPEILQANQYRDIWPIRFFGRRLPGDTCCQDSDLQNPDSALDQRIDRIYVRNVGEELPFTVVFSLFSRVVGVNPEAKTNTDPPLWPSDHGGVIVKMLIPSLGY